jgi:hypothetical protein
VATETIQRRARSTLLRLLRSDLDNDSFRWEAARVLRDAIGFDWWCWTLVDPVAAPPTRHLATNPILGVSNGASTGSCSRARGTPLSRRARLTPP